MCVFCKIVNKEIPAYRLYEDEYFLAILDISQATKGHTLVMTKKHFENIYELDKENMEGFLTVCQSVALKIKEAYAPSGLNLLNNNGIDAGQSIFHFHMHLIPRYHDDSVSIHLKNNVDKLTKEDYQIVKDQILKIK